MEQQFSSVAQLCPTLCDPMNHSMPGLPVHHQLPESTQIHVHCVVMPSNHLILCCPLPFLPSIFSSIRDFSNESAFCIRCPKYWCFSFSISPSNEQTLILYATYLLHDIKQYLNDFSLSSCCESNKAKFPRLQ